MHRPRPKLQPAILILALLAALTHCKSSNGQALPPPTGETAAPQAAAPTGQTQGPTYLIEHASVTLTPSEPGMIQLRVTPAPGYKVNTLYPWELTLQTGDPLTLERVAWDAASAQTLTEEEAVFMVPVAASEPGSYAVAGDLRFSICNDYRCQTPQANVAWAVTVQ